MQAVASDVDFLIARIQAEYREMPGLSLTEPQARRIWQLDRETCAEVLNLLVRAKFLRRNRRGMYVRVK
jgi:hypothetical protein